MLPGPGATQLGIYIGYVRAGWWGGAIAGLCFILPALAIMLALTSAYAWLQWLLPVLCFSLAAWAGRPRRFKATPRAA